MMLPRTVVEDYLHEAREIGSQHILYDIHVHPFELRLKPIQYSDDPRTPGVLTVKNSTYRKPSAKAIDLAASTEIGGSDSPTAGALSLQALMAYRHAGRQVLADRMTLSGIGACMLLPVPVTLEKVQHDLQRVDRLQDADPNRFMYAVGVPGDVTDANAFLGNICSQFSPRAVKLHPNFSAIDLGSTAGRQSMESTLHAASEYGLPTIVHGGRSILLPKDELVSYACIENLLSVDWSASDMPVIISHAGAFGCSLAEAKESILPGMRELCTRHPHLRVDTAGLSYQVLSEVLKQLGPERVLFGSDEMYFHQWQAMATLVHACKSLWGSLAQEFISITHGNSAHVLQESTVTT
jgi:predicted TIM-barrel fold metal-dependent hydrolase